MASINSNWYRSLPIRLQLIVAVASALLLVFTVAVIHLSSQESLSIADVEVPEAMQKSGYTSSRLEVVLQEALQGVYAVDDMREVGERRLQECSRRAESRILAARGSPGAKSLDAAIRPVVKTQVDLYGEQLARTISKPLSITVPGQAQTPSLLLRLAVAEMPFAKNQTFVTVNIAEGFTKSEKISILARVTRSKKGDAVVRITGEKGDLLDKDSDVIRELALRIIELVDPVYAFHARMAFDTENCNGIATNTALIVEKNFDEINPWRLIGILEDINEDLLSVRSADNHAGVSDVLKRLTLRAKSTYGSDLWPTGMAGAVDFFSSADCWKSFKQAQTLAYEWPPSETLKFPRILVPHFIALRCLEKSESTSTQDYVKVYAGVRSLNPSNRSAIGLWIALAYLSSKMQDRFNPADEVLLRTIDSENPRSLASTISRMALASTDADAVREIASNAALKTIGEEQCRKLSGSVRTRCMVAATDEKVMILAVARYYLQYFPTASAAARYDICSMGVAVNPSNEAFTDCVALAAEHLGIFAEAHRGYSKAYRLAFGMEEGWSSADPKNLSALGLNAQTYKLSAARVLYKQGQYIEAENLITDLSDSDNYARNLRIWAAGRRCDLKKIRQLTKFPSDNSIATLDAEGRLSIRKGDFKKAKTIARKALDVDRESPIGHILLSIIYTLEGATELAAHSAQRAQDLAGYDSQIEAVKSLKAPLTTEIKAQIRSILCPA